MMTAATLAAARVDRAFRIIVVLGERHEELPARRAGLDVNLDGRTTRGGEIPVEQRQGFVIVEAVSHRHPCYPGIFYMTPDELVAKAQAAWPVWPGADAAAFRQFIEALKPGDGEEAVPFEDLHAGDLWLAFHAGRGVEAAVAAVEKACFADLHAILRARRADASEAEEVVQRIRHRLLVPEPGEPSRIHSYGGRGELRAWVRVAAVRAWLNLKRENPVGAATAESAEDALVNQAAGDLELELIKGKYQATFRRVFLETLNELEPSTRLLLKLHYIDRLAMEEVGKILGVHRLTVLRRLEKARQELSEGTKGRLEKELRLAPAEVTSLLRLIQSRLDMSLQTALGAAKSDPQPK